MRFVCVCFICIIGVSIPLISPFADVDVCVLASRAENASYNSDIATIRRDKMMAITSEQRAFKNLVNAMYYRHKSGHGLEKVYKKNYDDLSIKHNNNLRMIDAEYERKATARQDILSEKLKKIQSGDC